MMTTSKLTKSKFRLTYECPTKLYFIDKPQYANQLIEEINGNQNQWDRTQGRTRLVTKQKQSWGHPLESLGQ
jgi:hypothetical protein